MKEKENNNTNCGVVCVFMLGAFVLSVILVSLPIASAAGQHYLPIWAKDAISHTAFILGVMCVIGITGCVGVLIALMCAE